MNSTVLLFCCVMLTGMAGLPCALAQSQLTQTVRLPDGSVYQGELVELVPGDHLTLRLVGGEIKRFLWSEIQMSGASGGGVTPGALGNLLSPLLSRAGALAPPAPEDQVQLHFQATDPAAVLFSTRAAGGIHFNSPGMNFENLFQDWTMVCPRPACTVNADRRLIYSIQGPWIIRSLPFTLPQGSSVTVDAHVAHQGTRTALTWLSVLGVGAAITGVVLLTFGGVQDTTASDIGPMAMQMQQDVKNRQQTFYTAGGALLGGGALLAIVGIVSSVYTRTTIKFRSDGRLALRLPGKSQLDLSSLQVHF